MRALVLAMIADDGRRSGGRAARPNLPARRRSGPTTRPRRRSGAATPTPTSSPRGSRCRVDADRRRRESSNRPSRSSRTLRACLAQGSSLLALLGRRAEAERLARRALELDAGQLEAVRVLADLAASRSFGPKADPAARAEAIRLYERLSVEDKTSPDEIWSALARLKLASGDGDGAVAAARNLLLRRPGDENALRLLDQSFVSAGRTKEALETTLAWIKAHPDSSDDLLPLVVEMARETGQWATDRVDVRRDARGEPRQRPCACPPRRGSAEAGAAARRRSTTSSSRARRARATRWCGSTSPPRIKRSTGWRTQRRWPRAWPRSTRTTRSSGSCWPRRWRGAASATRPARSMRPRFAASRETATTNAERRDEIRLRVAAIDLTAKRFDAARAMLSALGEARLSRRRSRCGRARRSFAATPRRPSGSPKLLAAAQPVEGALIDGEADLTMGRSSRADDRFEAAVAKGGAAARGDVAAILRRNGRDADAEKQLRSWVSASPADAEGRLSLGALLERTGRLAEAEVELREAIRLDARSAEARNYLGYSFADRGAAPRRGARSDPSRAGSRSVERSLSRLARMGLLEAGAPRRCARPARARGQEFPNDATVLEHLGDYYDRTGDGVRAKVYWQRALEAIPEKPETPGSKETLQKKLDKVPVAEGQPGTQAAVVPSGP